MKSTLNLILLLIMSFILSSCDEIETPNGEIPSEYLSAAKKYEGTYTGQFEGTKGSLHLIIVGNKPKLTFEGEHGTDILDMDCDSKIGDLHAIKGVQEDNGQAILHAAIFNFDPRRCRHLIQDRYITLDFSDTSRGLKIKASIVQYQDVRRVCDGFGYPPYQDCRDVWESNVYYGTFYKSP